ncbi:thioredoxin family protein [Leucothrix arctica]|uniref:Thioredoxin family protein n=1 Tax=Leucothrix arctica TaxID=1481894 RepID=A0A317CB45_9GAMM|nr:thioredoxin family protein [Leucothrix arctica]PWQ95361.1 thioredoxin family protein [Leucothrix arctica]
MLLDTPLCDFGWKAPDFTLKSFDGKEYTLPEQVGDNGLLVAFICNHCPYVIAAVERLAKDAVTLKAQGINTVAVMSNDYLLYPADSPANMKLFAEKYQFIFPYLVDEDQSIGKAYGATCTPDFFGFNNVSELQYRGRLDDAGSGDSDGRTPELLDAMRLVAQTGTGPAEQQSSVGCSIKWR